MPGADHGNQRLAEKLLETEPDHPFRVRQTPDREFDRARLQALEQFRVGAGGQAHDHARPKRGEQLQHRWDQRSRDGRQNADLQRGRSGAFRARQQIDALPQCTDAGARMRHEQLPLAGRHGAVAAALEQLHTENRFQFSDRLGDRRLRNRQAFGGPLHAAELRDGQKALEMTEFDAAVREAALHNERLYEKGENVILHNRPG